MGPFHKDGCFILRLSDSFSSYMMLSAVRVLLSEVLEALSAVLAPFSGV